MNMKCITLVLFLACCLGAFASLESRIPRKRFNPKPHPQLSKDPGVRNAPGNCNPKKIPKFRNFNTNSITGTSFPVLTTPRLAFNFSFVASLKYETEVISYERPDCTKEKILSNSRSVVLKNGQCNNLTEPILEKFGEGQDSAIASRVGPGFADRVLTVNNYFIDVDTSTGTVVRYVEVLENGMYLAELSYIEITVTDPSRPVDLSRLRGLRRFCGEEAQKEDFYVVLDQDTSVQCTG